MSPDMTIMVKVEDVLTAHLEEMRALTVRMEAAAAQLQPVDVELVEGVAFETATLRPIAPELPLLGTAAAAIVAVAALAGSSTKRVTRRALLTFGFLRGER